MKRREFVAILVAAVPRLAKSAGARRRVAIFSPAEPSVIMSEGGNRYYRALLTELRRLGYVEGQGLVIERYGRDHNTSGPAALAAEVVRNSPDVVYAIGEQDALLLKRETEKIPIVALTGDPVAIGLVNSLARPGGNITGVSVQPQQSIVDKRIALLREVVPNMSKLAFLTQRVDLNSPQTTSVRAAAEAAGIRLHISIFDVPTRETVFQEAIETAASNGASAILVADSAEATTNRGLIVRLIATIGMPAMYAITEFVDEGGLIAYSYDLVDLNKRVANDIDAILRGANPGDIPYYQATRFELSLNMKTANALGLTVPPALLAVADRVVE